MLKRPETVAMIPGRPRDPAEPCEDLTTRSGTAPAFLADWPEQHGPQGHWAPASQQGCSCTHLLLLLDLSLAPGAHSAITDVTVPTRCVFLGPTCTLVVSMG